MEAPVTEARERLSLVDQVRRATYRKNRLAMWAGAILGGFVPLASYILAHYEVADRRGMWFLVGAALLFSAKSVFDFGCEAFDSPLKAFGFVMLLEGVMVLSSTWWLGGAALALLVGINAVETGTNLALDHSLAKPERKLLRRRKSSQRGELLSTMEAR
jgi:hypothetical protein